MINPSLLHSQQSPVELLVSQGCPACPHPRLVYLQGQPTCAICLSKAKSKSRSRSKGKQKSERVSYRAFQNYQNDEFANRVIYHSHLPFQTVRHHQSLTQRANSPNLSAIRVQLNYTPPDQLQESSKIPLANSDHIQIVNNQQVIQGQPEWLKKLTAQMQTQQERMNNLSVHSLPTPSIPLLAAKKFDPPRQIHMRHPPHMIAKNFQRPVMPKVNRVNIDVINQLQLTRKLIARQQGIYRQSKHRLTQSGYQLLEKVHKEIDSSSSPRSSSFSEGSSNSRNNKLAADIPSPKQKFHFQQCKKCEMLKEELDLLNKQLRMSQLTIDQLKDQNIQISTQNNRLLQNLKNIRVDISPSKGKEDPGYLDYQNAIKKLQEECERLRQERLSLNQRETDRSKAFQSFQVNSSMSNHKKGSSKQEQARQKQELNMQIEQSKSLRQKLSANLSKLQAQQTKSQSLQEKLSSAQKERIKSQKSLKRLQAQMQHLKQRLQTTRSQNLSVSKQLLVLKISLQNKNAELEDIYAKYQAEKYEFQQKFAVKCLEYEDSLKSAASKLASSNQTNSALSEQCIKLSAQLKALQKEKNSMERDLSQLRAIKDSLQNNSKKQQQRLLQLESVLQQKENALSQNQEESHEKLAQLRAEYDRLTSQSRLALQKAGSDRRQSIERQQQQHRRIVAEQQSQIAQLFRQIKGLSAQKKGLQGLNEQLQQQLKRSKLELKQAECSLTGTQQLCRLADCQNQQLRKEVQQLRQQLYSLQNDNQQQNQESRLKQAELQKLGDQCSFLENEVTRMDEQLISKNQDLYEQQLWIKNVQNDLLQSRLAKQSLRRQLQHNNQSLQLYKLRVDTIEHMPTLSNQQLPSRQKDQVEEFLEGGSIMIENQNALERLYAKLDDKQAQAKQLRAALKEKQQGLNDSLKALEQQEYRLKLMESDLAQSIERNSKILATLQHSEHVKQSLGRESDTLKEKLGRLQIEKQIQLEKLNWDNHDLKETLAERQAQLKQMQILQQRLRKQQSRNAELQREKISLTMTNKLQLQAANARLKRQQSTSKHKPIIEQENVSLPMEKQLASALQANNSLSDKLKAAEQQRDELQLQLKIRNQTNEKLSEEFKQVQIQLRNLLKQNQQTKIRFSQVNKDLSICNSQKKELEQLAKSMEQEIQELSQILRRKQQELMQSSHKIVNLTIQLQNNTINFNSRVAQLNEQTVLFHNQNNKLIAMLQNSQQQINRLVQQSNTISLQNIKGANIIDLLQAEMLDRNSTISKLNQALSELRKKFNQLSELLRNTTQDNKLKQAQILQLNQQLRSARTITEQAQHYKLQLQNKAIDELEFQVQQRELELGSLRSRLKDSKEKVTMLEQGLIQSASQVQSLERDLQYALNDIKNLNSLKQNNNIKVSTLEKRIIQLTNQSEARLQTNNQAALKRLDLALKEKNQLEAQLVQQQSSIRSMGVLKAQNSDLATQNKRLRQQLLLSSTEFVQSIKQKGQSPSSSIRLKSNEGQDSPSQQLISVINQLRNYNLEKSLLTKITVIINSCVESYQEEFRRIQEQYQLLQNQHQQILKQLKQANSSNKEYLQQINNLQVRVQESTSKLMSLKEFNEQLVDTRENLQLNLKKQKEKEGSWLKQMQRLRQDNNFKSKRIQKLQQANNNKSTYIEKMNKSIHNQQDSISRNKAGKSGFLDQDEALLELRLKLLQAEGRVQILNNQKEVRRIQYESKINQLTLTYRLDLERLSTQNEVLKVELESYRPVIQENLKWTEQQQQTKDKELIKKYIKSQKILQTQLEQQKAKKIEESQQVLANLNEMRLRLEEGVKAANTTLNSFNSRKDINFVELLDSSQMD